MDFFNTGIWLWKHTVNRYNSKQLSEEIENINKRITNIYSDIANAHFVAAYDAILAVEYSKSPSSEIRASIGHLREAFRIYQQLMGKKTTHHFLIFFEYEEDVIENEKEFYQCLAYLSALISIMYFSLQEPENAYKWKQQASDLFLSYLGFVTLGGVELEKINSCFVEEYSYDSWQLGWVDGDPGTPTVERGFEITESGQQYIKKWKEDVYNQFIFSIDQKRISQNY